MCIRDRSSSASDYMAVYGKKYLPVSEEGNSAFQIPVYVFDVPMHVAADTTAMGEDVYKRQIHNCPAALQFCAKKTEQGFRPMRGKYLKQDPGGTIYDWKIHGLCWFLFLYGKMCIRDRPLRSSMWLGLW